MIFPGSGWVANRDVSHGSFEDVEMASNGAPHGISEKEEMISYISSSSNSVSLLAERFHR